MTKNITRRKFTKAAAASSVFNLIPGKVLGANEKVNVAFIGCGGQGGGIAHNVYNTKHVNAVALCDVAMGTGHTAGTEKKFNGIPKFKDFRKMFDKMGKEIDAVTIGVPDHSFSNRYESHERRHSLLCQKPLAHTFQEIELMILAAEKKYKVSVKWVTKATQGPITTSSRHGKRLASSRMSPNYLLHEFRETLASMEV